jgi:hypothetical protein
MFLTSKWRSHGEILLENRCSGIYPPLTLKSCNTAWRGLSLLRGVGRIHLHPMLLSGDPLPILCCSTTPITLFTLTYLPLTVWNSRLCVAKFVSGQYTLCGPAANCLHLSPALPTATVCFGVYPQVRFRCVSLERVPPPFGPETSSSSFWANTDISFVSVM